jgi:hypothetical protein
MHTVLWPNYVTWDVETASPRFFEFGQGRDESVRGDVPQLRVANRAQARQGPRKNATRNRFWMLRGVRPHHSKDGTT